MHNNLSKKLRHNYSSFNTMKERLQGIYINYIMMLYTDEKLKN